MKDANPLAAEMLETSAAGYASTANALLKQAPHRGTYSGAAARREACPAVLTRRVDRPVPRWLAVRKYRRYDAIAAISTAIGAQLIDASGLSRAQIDHIPSAVDPRRFSPNAAQRRSARAALGIGPDEFLIGAVGQLIARKGHDTLLDAMLSEDDAPAGPQLVRAQER